MESGDTFPTQILRPINLCGNTDVSIRFYAYAYVFGFSASITASLSHCKTPL
jgi:hypothetical protein